MTWAFWIGGELSPAGRLVWAAPGWQPALAAVVAVIVLGLAAYRRRDAVARVAEVSALTLGLAALVLAIARPVWVEEEGRVEPGRVAVLVDASGSMGVLQDGVPRSLAVQPVLDAIGTDHVDVYHFGGELVAGPPDRYNLPATDVEAALQQLSDRHAGEKLAGVVLITDGVDRGLLRRRYREEGNPVPPPTPGPLTVVQVGSPGDLKDLSVRSVDAGGYAYIHAPFLIAAHLEGIGFAGRTVRVDLSKDGKVVSAKDVVLGPDGTAEVRFEVTPDRAGRFAYLVTVPDYEGDAVPANNALPVVVRVVRDRIRVLQVAGAPSWDVKFLRRFLKSDPSIDLVSFFILRTHEDRVREFHESELSLIQFPYQELFTEDLLTFDLVVFQNFDYRPYFEEGSTQLLENLQRFVVQDGHGFVMVGGDRSFSLGQYGGTPLGDVLPVGVSTSEEPPDLAPFLPTLTDAGKRHPVTRLVSDLAENEAWWGRLHTNDGTNLVLDAHPDAAVLLTHPTLKAPSGRPMPVLAVREVGEGRTMSLTVDTSWRWSLSEAAVGRGNQAYLRFWKNAFRWLVGDPTAERLAIESSRENYAQGEEVRVVVHARDAGFAPLAQAAVRVQVIVDGEISSFDATTDAQGEATVTFVAERRGAHQAQATVKVKDEVMEAATVFAVTNRDPELDEVLPDEAFLRWLAQRTQGRYVAPGEAVEVVQDPAAGRTVWDRKETALWRAPILALLIGLGLGVAWIVRRRSGLR